MRNKETLEEAAENHYDIIAEKSSLYGRDEYIAYSQGVQDGVKFQQERMYSEEDMKLAYKTGARLALISQSDLALCKGKFPTPDEWFNEFQKT